METFIPGTQLKLAGVVYEPQPSPIGGGDGAWLDEKELAQAPAWLKDLAERTTNSDCRRGEPATHAGAAGDDAPESAPASVLHKAAPIPSRPMGPLPDAVTKIEAGLCGICGKPTQRKFAYGPVCSGHCLPFNPSQPRVLP